VGDFVVSLVPRALEASEAGRREEHDRIIQEAISSTSEPIVVMGQYSMTRAGEAVSCLEKTVLTGPDSAVRRLKSVMCPQRIK
jgi:hypothetical protein